MLRNEMLPIKPKNLVPPKKQPCLDVEVLNDIIKNRIRTDDELVLFSKKQYMKARYISSDGC